MNLYSVKQTAELIGISRQRVRKLLADGRIKGKKLDGRWVVLKLEYTRKRNYPIKGVKNETSITKATS